jgi:hypothetical protein
MNELLVVIITQKHGKGDQQQFSRHLSDPKFAYISLGPGVHTLNSE